jgi:hypothetical protein
MKFFTPLRLVLPPHFAVINPGLLIVPPELQAQAQRMLDSARFRELIEPGLREVFASAYDQEVA